MRSLLALLLVACSSPAPRPVTPTPEPEPAPTKADFVPPIAQKLPHELPSPHGATRIDNYYWMRDDTRKDPRVIAHLERENTYAKHVLGDSKETAAAMFGEMRARIKEDDATVPTFDNGYWYYTRFETGKQHPIHARKKGTLTAAEEVLLDGNALADGKAFYKIGDAAVSRDNKLLAWTDDVVGRNQFVLHVKELATGNARPDTATLLAPDIVWANDSKTLFYVTKDATTLREDKVWRLPLGGTPTLVHDEKDGEFSASVHGTKSRAFIQIGLRSLDGGEVRLIDATKPTSVPRVVVPRERGHIYGVEHLDGRFVILTNDKAKNYRLVSATDKTLGERSKWKDVVAHDENVLLEDVAVYRDFIALTQRSGGLRKVRVLPTKGEAFVVDAPDAAYVMSAVDTPDPAAKKLRFSYQSPTQPASVFELDLASKQRELLKQQPAPTYDAALYTSEYLHATASDGTEVPVTVIYKKTTKRDGSAPLLVYGYGSYGYSMEPAFNANRFSLLDRGWVYAIAHIRGGQEMGRAWYDAGKLMHKKNTFTDFVAVTDHLVAQKFGAKGHVFAHGGSAGGLLMGAVANLRPELYRGIIADVPFVDVITTMTDVTIPLTTNEFVEWGNPIADAAAYAYMLSYSPYDNIVRTGYPAIYVKTGLWDSQVQYYEPAKWVAKLRELKTDANPVLLVTDMTSGHGGASGRFDRLHEVAEEYAFLVQFNATPDRR